MVRFSGSVISDTLQGRDEQNLGRAASQGLDLQPPPNHLPWAQRVHTRTLEFCKYFDLPNTEVGSSPWPPHPSTMVRSSMVISRP